MKSVFVAIVLGFVATVSGQSGNPGQSGNSGQSGSLPSCAQPCIAEGLGQSDCKDLTNTQCFCNDQKFTAAVKSCVIAKCSASDLQKAAEAAKAICPNLSFAQPGASSTPAAPPSAPHETVAPSGHSEPPNPHNTEAPSGHLAPLHPHYTGAPPYGSAVASTPCTTGTMAPKPMYPTNPVPTTMVSSYSPSGTGYPVHTKNSTFATAPPSAPASEGAASRFGASLGVVGLVFAGFLML